VPPQEDLLSGRRSAAVGGVKRRRGTTMGEPPPAAAAFVLSIRQEPPRYLFGEESFSIAIVVTQQSTTKRESSTRSRSIASVPKSDPEELEEDNVRFYISAALHPSSERTNAATPPSALGALPTLSLTRQDSFLTVGAVGTMECCIRRAADSRGTTDAAYQMHITARTEDATTVLRATTVPLYLVRHKLLWTPSSTDAGNAIWYKDEGGRDKCMEVTVGLYDAEHRVVVPETAVPLQVTLCYAAPPKRRTAPVPVSNQEILRILSPKSPRHFTVEKPILQLRFRIEDVSKNHQGQDFCLRLAVAAGDVAPAMTHPVNVRSKRNKRPRLAAPSDPWEPPRTTSTETTTPEPDALREIQEWAEAAVRAMGPWTAASPALAQAVASYQDSVRGQLQCLPQRVGGAVAVGAEMGRESALGHAHHPQYPPTMMYPPPSHSLEVVPYPPSGNLSSPSHYMASNRRPPFPYYPYPSNATTPMTAVDYTMDRSRMAYPHTQSRRATAWSSPETNKARENAPRSWNGERPAESRDRTKPTPLTLPSTETEIHRGGEEDVEYLWAKQFKSVRTGELLGYPAYSRDEELLGFYLASPDDHHHTFRPVPPEDFGVKELQQAKEVLRQAADPAAIQSLQQWGSIEHMIHRAMVYEWCQEIR
jgi:hypothetical protein